MRTRLRRNEAGSVWPMVGAIAAAMTFILSLMLIVIPYLNRSDDYANDPGDAPAGSSGDPEWQGRFKLKAKFTIGTEAQGTKVITTYQSLVIEDWDFTTEDYDGQPWTLSAAWIFDWDLPQESYDVKYTITFRHGQATSATEAYTDSGVVKVKNPEKMVYKGSKDSKWFFIWEEQTGDWVYDIQLKCKGLDARKSGIITIQDDGTPLYTG